MRCIIADAPARNACLGTKYYNGHFGCGRCTQKGVHDGRRMTFPEMSAPTRTNESFRNMDQPLHHLSESIFIKLPNLNMITQFPLDYLHLVCLGVGKRMMGHWTKGDFALPKSDIQIISARLTLIAATQPIEFQRKCRPLDCFSTIKEWNFVI